MPTSIEKITGVRLGGVYYTDTITGVDDDSVLTCEKIISTENPDLLDTKFNQVTAKHLRPATVIVRTRT